MEHILVEIKSESSKDDMTKKWYKDLVRIRIWLDFMMIVSLIGQIQGMFERELRPPIGVEVIHYALHFVCICCSLWSRFKNIKAIYLGLIML